MTRPQADITRTYNLTDRQVDLVLSCLPKSEDQCLSKRQWQAFQRIAEVLDPEATQVR